LYPDQLRQSQSGHRLLKMQQARTDALWPVWVTTACWILSKVFPTWAQAVASIALSLLAHAGLLIPVAALIIIALKVPEEPITKTLQHQAARVVSLSSIPIMRELLRRLARQATVFFTLTRTRVYRVFLEACRDSPRITREHYTRTKVLQRRLLSMPKTPTIKRPQKRQEDLPPWLQTRPEVGRRQGGTHSSSTAGRCSQIPQEQTGTRG
jgi:hypothetical protein